MTHSCCVESTEPERERIAATQIAHQCMWGSALEVGGLHRCRCRLMEPVTCMWRGCTKTKFDSTKAASGDTQIRSGPKGNAET